MQEILPGLYHWTSYHEGIGERVHSCYLDCVRPAVLIDPRIPDEGLGWFDRHAIPEHIYLTNRHHYRHSDRFQQAFGAKVWCHRAGLHEFTHKHHVTPFDHHDELPGGIIAQPVGVLCPEETALQLPCAGGVLAIGDALIREVEAIGFVSDYLMGEDPKRVKKGLRKVFKHHLELDFDHMVFAHGKPWINGAKAGLRQFLERLTG